MKLSSKLRACGAHTTEGFVRLPGLFKRCEIDLHELGGEFRTEPAGNAPDGAALVAVFKREGVEALTAYSVEVYLPDAEPPHRGRLVVRYCDVCRRWGELRSVHLCGENWHPHLGALLMSLGDGGAR